MSETEATPSRAGPRTSLLRCAGLLSYAVAGPGVGALLVAPLLVVHADWIRDHAATLALPLTLGGAVLCGLALLPTFITTVLLVWLYGLGGGLPLSLIAYAMAAAVGWTLFRAIGQRGMDQLVDQRPGVGVVRDALLQSGFWRTTWTVLLLRISPIVPFAMINAAAGMSRARPDAFILGTAAGLLPRGIIVGAWVIKLQTLSFDQPHSWPIIAGGLAVSIAVLMFLGRQARGALHRSLAVSAAPA
jgi:phospholipase D1/2